MSSGHYDGHAFRNRFHDECWKELTALGEEEFEPGEIDPPERIKAICNDAKQVAA